MGEDGVDTCVMNETLRQQGSKWNVKLYKSNSELIYQYLYSPTSLIHHRALSPTPLFPCHASPSTSTPPLKVYPITTTPHSFPLQYHPFLHHTTNHFLLIQHTTSPDHLITTFFTAPFLNLLSFIIYIYKKKRKRELMNENEGTNGE